MFILGSDSLSKPQPDKILKIKDWVTSILDLDNKTSIFIRQLECKDPNCPPVETVIALLRKDQKTIQKKVHKCVNDIIKKDIIHVLTAKTDLCTDD